MAEVTQDDALNTIQTAVAGFDKEESRAALVIFGEGGLELHTLNTDEEAIFQLIMACLSSITVEGARNHIAMAALGHKGANDETH